MNVFSLMNKNKPNYIFKLALIGDSMVGKTSIIKILNKNDDLMYVRTVGVDLTLYETIINNKMIQLHIYDTSGESCFDNVKKIYYNNMDIIIICYDVNSINTFINCKKYINDIRRNKQNMILVGCNIDCTTDYLTNRIIKYTDAKEYATSHNMEYMEISCHKKIGVSELFNHIIISLKNNMDMKLFNS